MTVGQRQKRNLIADLMRRRVEDKVVDILNQEKSITEIDRKVDPLVKQHFKELDVLFDYFNSGKEQPTELCDECLKMNKLSLIEMMMQRNFEKATEKMLDETSDIQQVDRNLTSGLMRLFRNIGKVYEFYGMKYEITDMDEEEGDEDVPSDQPEDPSKSVS